MAGRGEQQQRACPRCNKVYFAWFNVSSDTLCPDCKIAVERAERENKTLQKNYTADSIDNRYRKCRVLVAPPGAEEYQGRSLVMTLFAPSLSEEWADGMVVSYASRKSSASRKSGSVYEDHIYTIRGGYFFREDGIRFAWNDTIATLTEAKRDRPTVKKRRETA